MIINKCESPNFLRRSLEFTLQNIENNKWDICVTAPIWHIKPFTIEENLSSRGFFLIIL